MGGNSFDETILETCNTYEEANILEETSIKNHNNTLVPNGYNLRLGGNGSSPSMESRQLMSAARKNRIESEETKAKRKQTLTLLRSTPEYREQCRQRRLGIPHSKERIQNIKNAKAKIPYVPRPYILRSPRIVSIEERARKSEHMMGKPRPTTKCSVCGMVASTTNIKRWHNVNCKLKKTI
jgi:hypothetical protein